MRAHVLLGALAVIMTCAFLILPHTSRSENFYLWRDAQGKAWISNVDAPAGAEVKRITFPEGSPAGQVEINEFESCQAQCARQLQKALLQCHQLPPDEQAPWREQALQNFRACIKHCTAVYQ